MKPIKFKDMNCNYTASGCDDLPAFQEAFKDHIEVTSVWKPSAEDLKCLNEGGFVCLNVLGGQPPVAMWVQEVEEIES